MNDKQAGPGPWSRRTFTALSAAAAAAVAAPAAQAATMSMDVEIKTPDGTCDAPFIHPTTGAHPGVLIWTDVFGLRPSMRDMGKRMAAEGYSVLVPNPFYRRKAPVYRTDLQLREQGGHGQAAGADGRP